LVISRDGVFSKQADLLIVDDHNNSPLYAGARNKLWPVEAVFALIEVKTRLTPEDIGDAVAKARRFKALDRLFCNAGYLPRIADSLFVLWSFEAPAVETFKENFDTAIHGVPGGERPDLVIVPDRFVARSGRYLELLRLGQPNSERRAEAEAHFGEDLSRFASSSADVSEYGENSLLAGYVWLDSWLRQAGSRLADPIAYVSPSIQPSRIL
jgi:hypothetical protein